MSYSPSKVILYFFITVILLGTILLSMPFARQPGFGFSLIANLFTSTSAVCVTGLSVVDIGKYYTWFGQIIILLLIQIGGFGYMTLSTILGLFLGKIALRDRLVIKEILDVSSFAGLLALFKKIIVIVLIIEALGAFVLIICFMHQFSVEQSVYLGIFHSVSAFCNAGISLFSDNLEGFSNNPCVLLTIALLIIIGGIGFLVLVEVWQFLANRTAKLSLHSKIVLIMTSILIICGIAGFWFIEKHNVLQSKNAGYSLLNSFFMSVTARTAGFDSISVGLCTMTTAILLMVLMFIGASPGGTGGGIKTATFAIVFIFIYSTIREKGDINIFKRRISDDTIHKANVIFILSLTLIAIFTALMIISENGSMLNLLFEVTSAFGTVGLSRGITPGLTGIGKLLIILTMVIGRVGPLAFFLALVRKDTESLSIKYPEEKIVIG